jgi:hypothetical protein
VRISNQDRRGIARSVAPTSLRRLDQAADLGRCQVLPRPALTIPPACRRCRLASESWDCPIFIGWHVLTRLWFSAGLRGSHARDCRMTVLIWDSSGCVKLANTAAFRLKDHRRLAADADQTVLITGDRSSPATWAMTKEHLESSSTSEARVGRPADKTLSSHNPCYAKSSLTIEKL